MHICLTVNAAWNLVNFREPLIRALLGAGHRVSVLAPADPTFDALRRWGCHCVDLKMDVEGLSPRNDFMLMRRMRAHFDALDPDVVLGFTIKNNLFGAIAAQSLGIPFVPTITGLGTAFLSGRTLQYVTETLYRYAFRSVPYVIFQNADDQKLFLKRRLVRPEQAQLSPGSGIDTSIFPTPALADTTQGVTFLMIARLLSAKGVHEYVEAANMVRATRPDARFCLLGPADAKNRHAITLSDVQDWTESGAVTYLGATDDVQSEIAKAHCVVLPSYREGTPRTLLEAASMGRPCIATNVPGCRQVVRDGENGFLCDVKSADSLASQIHRFLGLSPERWKQMGQTGRAYMETNYDARIVCDLYSSILTSVTNKPRKGGTLTASPSFE